MKIKYRNNTAKRSNSGFTLIELAVAIGIFLAITAPLMYLIRNHTSSYTVQQGQAAINIGLRTAISQMQMDAMNAGAGFYPGANVPGSPVGMTIKNKNPGNTDCRDANKDYTDNCFDELNIITYSSAPPAKTAAAVDTSLTGQMVLAPVSTALNPANYKKGDELLIVSSAINTVYGLPQYMTVVLTSDATGSSGAVTINYTQTLHDTGCQLKLADETLTDPYTCYANQDEKFGITPSAIPTSKLNAASPILNSYFDASAFVVKLTQVTYKVVIGNDKYPQLVREDEKGNQAVVADNIVGFRVGAMTWGGSASVTEESVGDDRDQFIYDPANYFIYKDFSLIRAIRVSLIARARNADYNSSYKNEVDQGKYRVEAVSAVISPRNLTMHDLN